MSATQDYVALDWIKGEISQTLEQARHALEAVAESPDDASSMRSCLTSLHQVHGTMKMVELAGPSQVAEEMEQLAQALMNASVPDTRQAQEVLMQSILQMPGYLDLIQREQSDSEKNYLPLVNNLRVARGESRIGGVVSEEPVGHDLSPVTKAPAASVVDAYVSANGPATLPKLKQRYKQALAALVKRENARENLNMIGKVFSMLVKVCGDSPVGNLAQLGLALVEGVATGAIKLSAPVANALRSLDDEIVRLAEGGAEALSDPVSSETALEVLELIETASKDTARILIARKLFTAGDAAGDQGSETVTIGPDDETLAAVAGILIEELRSITDKLDLYVRSADRSTSALVELLPGLEQISSTLNIVKLEEHQDAVVRQIAFIKENEQSGAVLEEEALLDMAKDLLKVESVLAAIVGESDDGPDGDSFGDLDEAQAAVIRETRTGLAQCRDRLIDYVSSNFDRSKIESLPAELHDLRGGLLIVNQQRSSEVLIAASRYVQSALLDNDQTPELSAMDDLADAITSIDYFLERLLENSRDPYLQMVEVAETAVAKLGFVSGEEDVVGTSEEIAEAIEEEEQATLVDETVVEEIVAEELVDEELVEDDSYEAIPEPDLEEINPQEEAEAFVIEEVAEEAFEPAEDAHELDAPELPADEPSSQEAEVAPVTQSPADEPGGDKAAEETADDELIDDEILEIFAEEIEEVLETLNEFFPAWQSDFSNSEAMTELRRAFHTLKGSGRMVGATVLGELAWSVENMLNRVIDQTIQPSVGMATMIAEVIGRVPEGLEYFKNQDQQSFLVDELVARVEALASGEAPLQTQSPADSPVAPDDAAVTEVEEPAEPSLVGESPEEVVEDDEFEFELDETAAEPESVADAEVVDAADLETEPEPEPEPVDFGLADVAEEVEANLEEEVFLETVDEAEEVLDIPGADELVEGFDLPDALDGLELDDLALDDILPAEVLSLEESPQEGIPEEALEEVDAGQMTGTPESDTALPVDALTTEELADADDFELDDIFVIEANERLEVVRAFLTSPGEVSGDLVAAFHTLKGSAAMAEIPSISRIAAPLEQLANQYLTQNLAVDETLVGLVARGGALMAAVVADLDAYRDHLDGIEAFESDVGQGTAQRPDLVFNFEKIRLLSQEEVVSENWQPEYLAAVRDELEHAGEQAVELGQLELQALIEALLSVYNLEMAAPDEFVIATLGAAHEQLVSMFDHIASGLSVESAADIIQILKTLEPAEAQELADVLDTEDTGELAEAPDQESTPTPAGTLLPEDDVDPDILPIFLEEADELLEGIDQSILEWSEDSGALGNLDNLLRHLHTLKGGSRMAGLNSLGEFTHNFETVLIGVQQNPVEFDEAFFAILNQRQDEITRRVEIYRKFESGDVSAQDLASMRFDQVPETGAVSIIEPTDLAVEAAEEAPIAAIDLPADQIDEDVLPIFLEETDELLEGIDESIQHWSENPAGSEHLDNLLRHLHTLKGGARMAGMNSLGEYTHNFESYLIGIQQKPVDMGAQFFGLLNQRQDEITRRVGIYTKLASGEASAEELASLTKEVAGTPVSAESGEQLSTAEPVVADQEADRSPPTPASQAQEMVRVSSDLLESLVSLAGESSITRGRVEQQISDFGEALQEMEETIGRIREQVRRLEIEAESRETLIRTHSTEDSDYDELEMDRYTMLQEISRTLSESSSDMLDLKETLVNRSRDAETLLHQQARIGSELQEGLTRTRMVPFARLIPRLRRIVRQVSGEIGKSVRFDAFNIEGELDRTVLERIVAPLEHMLRNAVDHGIESTEDRAKAGKSEQGRISLRLSREGGYVILNVSDDGGGINVDAVRTKAIERGLITEETTLTDQEIMQFIMDAGFSTAQKLTQISGRGVGMDVVVSEIKALGGSISIDSTYGVGTEFTIRIPFTVSINRALMVVVREETYAVPLNTIEGIVRVSPYELEAYYQPDAPMFEYAGQPYRLGYMGEMLENSDVPDLTGQVAPLPVILARSGDNAVALQVDRVIGSREVVVKTLGPQFNEVGGLAGATVLGDGSVVIILDVMALVRSHDLQAVAPAPDKLEEVSTEPQRKVRLVMIVDDSVTVRKVTSRLMERQGFEVATAKDGVDAMSQLQDIYPDVVLLDIEMPKMDGFEVLRAVRHDERLKRLPIIMITSRTGEKHKQEALELGVNRYLGKPFQEASLLSTIEEVLNESKSL